MFTNLELLISIPILALAIAFGCEQKAKTSSSDDDSATSEDVNTYTDTDYDTSTITDCFFTTDTSTGTSTSTDISTTTDCGSTSTATGYEDFYDPQAKTDCANSGMPYIYIQGHEGCLQSVTLVANGSSWCTDRTTILNQFVAKGYSLDNAAHPETSLNYNWDKATADGSVVDQCGILTAQLGSYPVGTPFVSFVHKTTTTDASGNSVPKVTQWGLPDILPK